MCCIPVDSNYDGPEHMEFPEPQALDLILELQQMQSAGVGFLP